jgi:hypothetical protein
MSEIEMQQHDLNSFQQHLERICKDLEDGVTLTLDEIGDLRYACGLPQNSHVNPVLRDVINDFANVFGLQNFPTIRGEK